ncbi:MAG: T9SS type A sorting domain-containing protein [Bacteroidota bacterium]
MKLLMRLFLFCSMLSVGQLLHGQVIINEVKYGGTSDTVELKNVGTTTVNVSSWWFCYRFVYNQLNSLTASGNLNMAPGSIVYVTGLNMNNSSSDLGLYNSGSFGSSTAMQDFVQYGQGGIGRESVAVMKGIWTAGEFVPTVANANNSIENNGCGNTPGNWVEQTTASFGQENAAMVNVDGGMVVTEVGEDTIFYCVAGQGGMSPIVAFDSTTTSTESYAYIVTDANGMILGLPPGDVADFSNAGTGLCLVYGLSYSGSIVAQLGDNVNSDPLSDGCYELSSNVVWIARDSVAGGTVFQENGGDTVYVCYDGVGNGLVSFDNSNSLGGYAYVATDPSGTILGATNSGGNTIDFSGAGVGECWVYGVAHLGTLNDQAGMSISQAVFSEDCYMVSSNFVVVFRDSVDGGNVLSSMGEDTVEVCLNDESTTIIDFASSNAFGDNFAYVVTDPNGTILGLPPGNQVNFSGAGTGECWVWGLSYSGNLTAMVGGNATVDTLSDGCFNLSKDFVVVLRDSVAGGTISTEIGMDTIYVCLTDTGAMAGIVAFDSAGTFGTGFQYVVTDTALEILGLPPGDEVDFLGAGVGECWVWGVSYTGEFLAQVGDTASEVPVADSCFQESDNFIVIMRDTSVEVCGTTGIPDALRLESLELYPVPATDLLKVSFSSHESRSRKASINVLDMTGRIILSQQHINTAAEMQEVDLQVSSFSPGMYIIQVQSGEKLASRSFVKK